MFQHNKYIAFDFSDKYCHTIARNAWVDWMQKLNDDHHCQEWINGKVTCSRVQDNAVVLRVSLRSKTKAARTVDMDKALALLGEAGLKQSDHMPGLLLRIKSRVLRFDVVLVPEDLDQKPIIRVKQLMDPSSSPIRESDSHLALPASGLTRGMVP